MVVLVGAFGGEVRVFKIELNIKDNSKNCDVEVREVKKAVLKERIGGNQYQDSDFISFAHIVFTKQRSVLVYGTFDGKINFRAMD